MAEQNTGPRKSGWKKVTKTYRVRGGARRGSAAVTVSQHGATTTNAESAAILFRTAIARGIDPTREFCIDMAVDEERQMIGLWATAEPTLGTSTITLYKKGASAWVAFHVGAAFLEAPALRPELKQIKCLVAEELDEDGLPIMVIPIKAGKAKNTHSRDSSGESAGAS